MAKLVVNPCGRKFGVLEGRRVAPTPAACPMGCGQGQRRGMPTRAKLAPASLPLSLSLPHLLTYLLSLAFPLLRLRVPIWRAPVGWPLPPLLAARC